MSDATPRRLVTAEILSIGSELTVGDTRDTNAGELAHELAGLGVRVGRMTALPDQLDAVTGAFSDALDRSDLVLSTGGLGPTPDDLTREAIAAACGESPRVDAELEAWLRALWARRGMPFPELNLKQAWLIPSAEALPNPNGTAPGWFVTRAGGRVIVAMPGPPREMRPMWRDEALPRLRALGIGTDVAAVTLRLTGIGESQLAERLGEALLRASNPIVATYARAEAVDVRISAVAEAARTAQELVDEMETTVRDLLAEHIWATGATTWAAAIGERLTSLGWQLAVVEIGTSGSFGELIGDTAWLRFAESIALDAPAAREKGGPSDATTAAGEADEDDDGDDLMRFARRAKELGGAEVGVAIRARPRAADTSVSIAISTPSVERTVRRVVFLTGSFGRSRSALAAAAFLLELLGQQRSG
jgi:nicotinamide-nucleotide amidase